MNLEIFNNLFNKRKENGISQKFIDELTNFIENSKEQNLTKQINKYNEYWNYQNFMEENVAANIGISRWSANIVYRDELNTAINNSILKLTQSEGVLYRKKFTPNGPIDNPIYNIDKFENGKIEHLNLTVDKLPKQLDNEDIIFQYKADGSIKIRNDLKEKIIKNAILETENLKEEELKKATNYKKEGHIYKAIEDDGYIFLKDITEERNYVLEDIDFVVDCYEGEGEYKVIDGVYKKISK